MVRTSKSDAVISFNASDIVTLTAVCVVNLFFSGLVHRAVIRSSSLLPRRQLFEGLSVFGFITAIALCIFSALTWLQNPVFVIACTALWSIFCTLVVARIWWGYYKNTHRGELELPDDWHETVSRNTRLAVPVEQMPTVANSHRSVLQDQLETPADQAANYSANVESVTANVRNADQLKSESALLIHHDKLRKYKRKRRAKTQSLNNLAAKKIRM